MKNDRLASLRGLLGRMPAFLAAAAVMAAICGIITPAPKLAAADFPVNNRDDIALAMQSAQAGDTLTMQNSGTWTDQDILFEGNGTADRPITLRAQTPGQVILTGTSRLRIGGSFLVVEGLYFKNGSLDVFGGNVAVVEFRARASTINPNFCNHCRLTNSAIDNYNPLEPAPDIANQYKWVALYGADNQLDHCTFKHKTNVGILMAVVRDAVTGEAQRHQIDHNYFVDRPPLSVNAGQIMQIGASADSMSDSLTTVESNLFEHCDGGREIISSKSGKNAFRYNTFVDSQGTLSLRHGNGSVVEGNFFFGNNTPGTGGVRIIGEDHQVFNNYFTGLIGSADTFRAAVDVFDGIESPELLDYFQVKNAVIAFNTFVDNERNIILGGGRQHHLDVYCPDPADPSCRLPLPPLNTNLANNVVLKVTIPQAQCLINIVDAPMNTQYEGNIMFGVGACLGISPTPDGIKEIDPKLVLNLLGDGLYRPDAGSALIGGAVGNYPMVTTDMDGQPRGAASKEVGADEVSTAPITRHPLTPQDVGPNWTLTP